MLIYVTDQLTQVYSGFNVFSYLTTRAIMSALTALVLSFAFGPYLIQRLTMQRIGQQIRQVGPESHFPKAGTPTMGGALILLAIAVSTLLWANLSNRFVLLVLGGTLYFGVIGFVDDYKKVILRNSKGLSVRAKLFWQTAGALGLGIAFYVTAETPAVEHSLLIPYIPGITIPLGAIGYVIFTSLVLVCASNGVNLTDGLDGLAAGCTVTAAFAYAILSYVCGHVNIATYLQIPFYPYAGELTIICMALVGASFGFLWFNCHPAKVFMGDTGSLAIGGMLVVVGGVFVIEAVSVLIQRSWFKITKKRYGEGRRVFLMSPLHHHFELKGWKENTVIVRFWILSIMFAFLGLATLKLR
jgi:phospho-N-acetylmuramoyl-pentapeptide-transferase